MTRITHLALVTSLFAVALAGTVNADLDYAVKLKTGDLNPSKMKLAPPQAGLIDKHVIVQFDGPVVDAERERLGREGIKLLEYVPNFAYTASVTKNFDPSTPSLSSIRWYDLIQPFQKLSPYITSIGIGDWARRGGDKVQYVVVLHRDQDPKLWAAYFQKEYNANLVGIEPSTNSVEIIVAEPAYNRLSELDAVVWIEPAAPEPIEYNNLCRTNTGADIAQAAPYNLNGSGVTVAEWDGGSVDNSHSDFQSRVIVLDFSPVSTHSTHVAGTVLGAGIQSSGTYRGMAPGAMLASQQWWNSASEAAAEYADVISTRNASISTNSWGYGVGDPATQSACVGMMGNYFTEDATLDNLVRGSAGRPITIAWAAGNERSGSTQYCGSLGWTYNTIGALGCAKNVITVGAITSSNNGMTSFSSWGPTDDGRLKPDVVGPGCTVTSVKPGGGYTSMCGTSMATPAVAGVVALMRQAWNQSFGITEPLPSTMKGILINTAIDLGNSGPDYQFGHGKVDAVKACAKVKIGGPSYQEGIIATGESQIFDLTVPSGTARLKVTLVWDDPGGSALVSKDLKNDLDLTLIDPSQVDQLPWILDPAVPGQVATKGDDHINNVETVEIVNPEPGLWKASVKGYNVPAESAQKYSIIFTPDSLYTPGNNRALAIFDGGDLSLNPGSFANVQFWVTNVGAVTDSMHVTISDSAGWLQSTVDTNVTLAAGDSVYFPLVSHIPSTALYGDRSPVTCNSVSKTDPLIKAIGDVIVASAAVHVISLSQPPDAFVKSPQIYTIGLTVQNLGNATNIITITPSEKHGWPFSPPNKAVTLTHDSSTIVFFSVDIPAEVVDLTVDSVTLKVTSTGGVTDSVALTLTVNNPFPPPALILPDTQAFMLSRTPTFTWSRKLGTTFSLRLSTDSMFANTARYYGGLTDTVFTIPLPDELSDGRYFWAVRLYSGADSSSLQRYSRRFVVDNVPPAPVSLNSPANGFYDSSTYEIFVLSGTPTAPPLFNKAPEFNVIQLAADSGFTVDMRIYNQAADFSYQMPDTLSQGRWYWRAKRADSAGNETPYSQHRVFVHDTRAPGVPVAVKPTGGMTVGGDNVVIKWTGDPPASYDISPESFILHVSNMPNFGEYGVFIDYVYADSIAIPAALLQSGVTYYWRAKSIDSAGHYSDYNAPSNFVYQNFICGDCDFSSSGPDISDLMYLIDYLIYSGTPPHVLESSSVDCNTTIDISDVFIIVDYLSGAVTSLCCP